MAGSYGFRSHVIVAIFFAASALPVYVSSYKILMVPLPSRSHVMSMAAMAEDLAKHGHESTFVIGESYQLNAREFEDRPEIRVVRYSDVTDGVRFDYNAMQENISRNAIESQGDLTVLASVMTKIAKEWCQHMLSDDHFAELEQEKFNLAVIDGIYFAKCVYLIPHRLQIPWVTYSDVLDPLLVRVPWLPSFVPNEGFALTERMNFVERLKNTGGLLVLHLIVLPLRFCGPPEEVLEKYRSYGSFNSLDELMSKSALFLQTKDSVLDYPRPAMPNMVDVGGLTVKRSTGQLPADIKSFMEGAVKGVILVTFGSMVATIPAHTAEKFTAAFSRLDGYRVIWRLENRDKVKIPDNVLIGKWLPQTDILAHPTVKLFITHSGNSGQYEAIYHAVPMIGFPLMADQMYNAKRIDHKGFGVSLNFYDFTADQLLDNIHRILGDKSYKERVTKASEIFRSQPQSPMERATYWIEHVCRFGGDHLRSAGKDLPLYSYLMLDILAFITVTLHVLGYVLYRVLRFFLRKICSGRASKDTSKKTN